MVTEKEAGPTQKEKHPQQQINPQKAAWVFISASPHEPRHLNDIIWAVDCLRERKVTDDNIFIFQDNQDCRLHLSPFNITKNIFELSKIENLLPLIGAFEFVFLIFTGHGSSEGVHTEGKVFAPTLFMNLVRSIKDLKNSILIIGQCYGGIFDYLDASVSPEIGAIGATKLHLSLSNYFPVQNIDLKNSSGDPLQPWAANVFLFYFFKWIRLPLDVDGDGVASLVDGFKYAGARSNETLTAFKTIQSLDINGKLEAAKKKIRDHVSKTVILEQIDLVTAIATAEDESKSLYLHQEPWILHANLLRSLIIL